VRLICEDQFGGGTEWFPCTFGWSLLYNNLRYGQPECLKGKFGKSFFGYRSKHEQ